MIYHYLDIRIVEFAKFKIQIAFCELCVDKVDISYLTYICLYPWK